MKLRLPGRVRPWHLWLVLLGLSQLWQAVSFRETGPHSGQRIVEVPRQRASGPASGPPVRIAYRDSGAGPPVVYLHGSPGAGGDSAFLASHLSERHRVLAPDLPGFGASSHWLPDYGIEAHARYVLAFMDALNLGRAHLVCHSMGSGVALVMTRLAPDRVASIVSYAGIGVQEGEGSGDYWLEHAKYGAGFALLVALPEFLPHFGALGPRWLRHSLIRNFWDTDQRPLRGMLESLQAPLLILQGRRDPLVQAWVGREHHRIVAHSEFVMIEASHFMVFNASGSERLAQEILPFLERHADPGQVPSRRTVDFTLEPRAASVLPTRLELDRRLGPWAQIAALAGATFLSEDLTCISAGLLVRDLRLDPFVAVLGCIVGIFLGDLGLWLSGRMLGRRALGWTWIAKRIPAASVERFGATFDRHMGKAVMASRFLPGTRLPMYLAAGVASRRSVAFAAWLFLAALIWAPLIVIAALILGPVAIKPLEAVLGVGWFSWVGAVVLLFGLLRVAALLCSWRGRARLAASFSKLWRWEFWPVWLFYSPLLPWIAWLAIRHRGITTPTAANPALPHGGFVGESKAEILGRLPGEWIQPSFLVRPGDVTARRTALADHAREQGWSLPLVLKPDEGQRGVGVKLAGDWEAVLSYLGSNPRAVLVQPYHPGPLEAGIFYYRMPGEAQGRIFSVTDKRFPEVVGDGHSTLEALILRDPRLRMQAGVFARRHADRLEQVPAALERVSLAVAGNHCQGTMFLEGARLRTPELARTIDEIARAYAGFHFGRFDVRYASPAELMQGRGFKIVELNGITSESTNIYDPSFGLFAAYRTLARQWALAFRIGADNRRRGHAVSSITQLRRAARAHYGGRTAQAVSD